MAGKRGWSQFLMASLYKKAATRGAAVTVNSANFVGIKGHKDAAPKHGDELITDLDEVTGSELVTLQEIGMQGTSLSLSFERVRPNTLVGFVAAALGGLTATQDGAVVAYKHEGSPCAETADLPDFPIIVSKAGEQLLYKGMLVNSFEIIGTEGKGIDFNVELIGLGLRETNAAGYIAALAEARLYMRHLTAWREEGTDISISANQAQGLEDISSTTPLNISARMKSFRVKYNNNVVLEPGAGSGSAVNLGADFGRRQVEAEMVLRYLDTVERAAFDAQTALAVEFDVKGASLIAIGGAMYPGFGIVLPKNQLSEDPAPAGGLGDKLEVPYKLTLMDDGVNNWFKFIGYTSKAAYMAP